MGNITGRSHGYNSSTFSGAVYDGEDRLNELPEELFEEILCRVPEKDLLLNCRRVCKRWLHRIDDYAFWIRVGRQHGVTIPGNLDLDVTELQRFVVKHNPVGRNLLKNWDAKGGLTHWKIHENGGNSFIVEEGHGSQSLHDEKIGVTLCWATSYGWCTKSQTVDLIAEGLTGSFLDRTRPRITVSEWTAARYDCGSIYQMKVQLLDRRKKIVAEKSKQRSAGQWGDNAWHKITLTFGDYVQGVRYIKFHHRGKDTKYWAGHYGAKMAAPSVVLSVR